MCVQPRFYGGEFLSQISSRQIILLILSKVTIPLLQKAVHHER